MIWTATYKSNKIKVVNNWFAGQKLYVNGELQDQTFGALGNARLTGRLIDAKGYRNTLKVSLHRGILKTKCLLFVNSEEIEATKGK